MQRSRSRLGLAFAAVALAGVGAGVTLTSTIQMGAPAHADSKPAQPAPRAPLPAPTASSGVSFVSLVKQAGPAVVNIQVEIGNRRGFGRAGQGQGTGFLISPDGTILTNDHVVGQASKIRVSLADGREFEGKVIGTDPRTDIAVIKIEDKDPFPSVKLGDSDAVEVGEWVIAIGNPFGLDHTVTAGIISAKGRRDVHPGGRRDGYFDFLQTDASINPGNSGGPLLNTRGEVIGINSAVSAQGQGLGFAIPINMAKTLLPLLSEHGRAPRSWLGVSIQEITKDLAQSLGLPTTDGALVAQVVPDSPAAKAGLVEGDVIVLFDGKKIKHSDELRWLASTAGIGKTVKVGVRGKDKVRDVTVTLGELPDENVLASRSGGAGTDVTSDTLGVDVRSVDERLARSLGLDRAAGAVITDVDKDSPAAGELQPGDVILVLGHDRVADAADLVSAAKSLREGQMVRLLVVRDGNPMWIAFNL